MPNIGPWEIVLLLLLALLLFGAKRLPEIGRSVGSSMREFKDAVTNKDDGHSTSAPAELPPAQPDTTATHAPREHDTV
jgi:sec-independent protein translocase protein TatA